MIRNLYFISLSLLISLSSFSQEKEPPNIIFIAVDDLRPDLGSFGNEEVKTPQMDKLASEGTAFLNHYVQVPTCGASRYSVLTGRLPRSTQHLSNEIIKNEISDKPESPLPETFIHHLKRNGYYTVGIGKISHYPDGLVYGYNGSPEGARRELPHSWDELLFDAGKWGTAWNAFFGYADGSNRQSMDKKVKPYEKADIEDTGYPDGLMAELAMTKLKELAGRSEPFFLGIGFFRPHLPFNAPSKYWDLYEESKISTTPSPDIPENVHLKSLYNNWEFRQYQLGEEQPTLTDPVSDAYARKLKHAYYASISYVDAQIGKVMTELERQGLADNTIIVVWGDHGWQLGDHRVWGKHTLYERALNSPLIIKAPGFGKSGITTNQVVSSIDIYPTLIDLTSTPTVSSLDGKSLVPFLKEPEMSSWEDVSYSYFNNGITLRTSRYRITKYFREEEPVIELYDHQKDPFENKNIANERPEIITELLPLLEKGNLGIY